MLFCASCFWFRFPAPNRALLYLAQNTCVHMTKIVTFHWSAVFSAGVVCINLIGARRKCEFDENLTWIVLGRGKYYRHTAEVKCYGLMLFVPLERCKWRTKWDQERSPGVVLY